MAEATMLTNNCNINATENSSSQSESSQGVKLLLLLFFLLYYPYGKCSPVFLSSNKNVLLVFKEQFEVDCLHNKALPD